MSDECFKIDMGCECLPSPPDKPRPFVFSIANQQTTAAVDATITFTSNATGAITGYLITNAGSGYRIAPTIVINGSGAGATATCTINSVGGVISVTITAAGAGYGASVNVPSTLTAGANNLITFDQLTQFYLSGTPFKDFPVGLRLPAAIPNGGGITLATAKIEIMLTYTVKTNGATDFTGSFLVNGVPVASTITVDDTATIYTPVTHYSGELTMLSTDYFTYQITSTESKLYDISNVACIFSVKYI